MNPVNAATRPVIIHDSTLRDGQHAVGHQLDISQIQRYAEAADQAGVPVVEVGHGNGLGASSLQIGRARLDDDTMLAIARDALTTTKLGAFMAPGWGTGKDVRRAVGQGVNVVRVAAHCTEVSVTEHHLGLVRELGVQAQAVLLMSHMAAPDRVAAECVRAVEFGAQAVGIMDSAGCLLPDDVTARVSAIVDAVDVPVIVHAHNNLGVAVANSIAAVQAGASIVDACARGIGAGAGNAQLEVLVAVLDRMGHPTGVDLRSVLHAADLAQQHLMPHPPTIDSVSVMSGLAGVFSGFRRPVLAAAASAGVDPLDVFLELGRRQVVAGQEDLIPDVVAVLASPRQEVAL